MRRRLAALTVVLAVTIAAIAGALVIDATGGFEMTDMVWLLVAGFGLGVVVTASTRSLSPVIGAIGSGSTALTGAALGVVAGSVLGLLTGTLMDSPAIAIAVAVALGALLVVPPVATVLGGLVGRWTRPLTGSASSASGIATLTLAAMTTLVVGLSGSFVAIAALALSVAVLIILRWGGRAAVSSAVLLLALVSMTVGSPVSAQEIAPPGTAPASGPPITVSADGIRKTVVEVRANQPVTDTGFDLLPGDSVHLVADGRVRLVAGDDGSVVDADGLPARYEGCPLGLTCGTLLASLQPTFGWQPMGSEGLIQFAGQGRLYLAVNDADPADSEGAFTVTIRAGPADALGVVLPTPPGISRDAVLAGDGSASEPPVLPATGASSDGAPAGDLVLAAGFGAAGALLGALAVRRATQDGGRSSESTTEAPGVTHPRPRARTRCQRSLRNPPPCRCEPGADEEGWEPQTNDQAASPTVDGRGAGPQEPAASVTAKSPKRRRRPEDQSSGGPTTSIP